jgi:hypothetical protein
VDICVHNDKSLHVCFLMEENRRAFFNLKFAPKMEFSNTLTRKGPTKLSPCGTKIVTVYENRLVIYDTTEIKNLQVTFKLSPRVFIYHKMESNVVFGKLLPLSNGRQTLNIYC